MREELLKKAERFNPSLSRLGLHLQLVQTEQNGTRHYKDSHGNRLALFTDGSFTIEPIGEEASR